MENQVRVVSDLWPAHFINASGAIVCSPPWPEWRPLRKAKRAGMASFEAVPKVYREVGPWVNL